MDVRAMDPVVEIADSGRRRQREQDGGRPSPPCRRR
jgi:hypothetical protein